VKVPSLYCVELLELELDPLLDPLEGFTGGDPLPEDEFVVELVGADALLPDRELGLAITGL